MWCNQMMPCIVQGCAYVAVRGGSRCVAHQRMYEQARSPKRKEYSDPAYKKARLAVIGMPCYVCGVPADTADHIVPVRMGGTWRDGLRPACRAHNSDWQSQ